MQPRIQIGTTTINAASTAGNINLALAEFTPFKKAAPGAPAKPNPFTKGAPDKGDTIKTVSDLRNAIKSAGSAKDPAAAKARAKSAAKRLGRMDLIPAGW